MPGAPPTGADTLIRHGGRCHVHARLDAHGGDHLADVTELAAKGQGHDAEGEPGHEVGLEAYCRACALPVPLCTPAHDACEPAHVRA